MVNALNLPVDSYDKAMKMPGSETMVKNMRAISGLKFLMAVWILIGNTYLYTYYAVVGDSI